MQSKQLEKFMNIWEIESNFKCPVVGTLLSVKKHESILKKCGYNTKQMKPYEYHRHIMSRLDKENNVSIKVNNFIRNQARKYMLMILDQPDEKIYAMWKSKLNTGDVGPMMFAIVAYQGSGVELLNDIHGEVHMLSHANMGEVFTARKNMAVAEGKCLTAQNTIQAKKEKIKELIKTDKKRSAKFEQLQAENRKLKKQLIATEPIDHCSTDEALKVSGNQDAYLSELKIKEEQLQAKEREKRSMEIKLFDLENENQALKDEIKTFLANFKQCCTPPACNSQALFSEESCQVCPQQQLCAKRIFMVGGMTKMKSYYQEIVENAGGEFYYHDGYVRNGKSNFEAQVKRCDVVICPVNCNSHNACLKVKKLCAQYNKPIKFLNNSSLSTVTQALFETNEEMLAN